MKLEELMNAAFDETWFCVTTPDGEEHFFWNADYLGWHPDVMPELEPLLERDFEDFALEIRKNPEIDSEDVPMVCVGLLLTEEELEERRKQAKKDEVDEKRKAKTKKGKA